MNDTDLFEMRILDLDMEAFVDAMEDKNFDKPWNERISEIMVSRKEEV